MSPFVPWDIWGPHLLPRLGPIVVGLVFCPTTWSLRGTGLSEPELCVHYLMSTSRVPLQLTFTGLEPFLPLVGLEGCLRLPTFGILCSPRLSSGISGDQSHIKSHCPGMAGYSDQIFWFSLSEFLLVLIPTPGSCPHAPVYPEDTRGALGWQE